MTASRWRWANWQGFGLAILALAACEFPTGQAVVTILATNDIHGGVEPALEKGVHVGGMARMAGAVKAIREGLEAEQGKNRGGVLVVDAGDQFQGTLLSNYDEGQLVFRLMNEVGYDAVVPGNHDYDFGPIGWLEDRVSERTEDKNPRGALERLARQAKFPLLSANTYFKASVVDIAGHPVEVSGKGCTPKDPAAIIDWSAARRPSFLQPYALRSVGQVRVALIGIDNQITPTTTTPENVSDLCFRDEAETYLDIRRELEGKADVFVLVMHNGNSPNQFEGTSVVKKITEQGADRVHAVVAGHTHALNKEWINGVPLIQSRSGGRMFGRIDLKFDFDTRKVRIEQTRGFAGVELRTDRCASWAVFCRELKAIETAPVEDSAASAAKEDNVTFDQVPVKSDARIETLIAEARRSIEGIAKRPLGKALTDVTRDRIAESALVNAVTDALRTLSGANVAMVNTSMLREDLKAGDIDYETLFSVLPISNRAVVVGPISAERLVRLLERSVKTCGAYGALVASGLKVRFERDCQRDKAAAPVAIDEQARLLRVETLGGEVIFDRAQGGLVASSRSFTVATVDFLADGGAGYSEFLGTPKLQDLGVLREALADEFAVHPVSLNNRIDGRWALTAPALR